MIIRHDLSFVYTCAKCAGSKVDLKTTNDQSAVEELWNYEYNKI